jgi:tRNA nucleotidyltransferase (CCA-adding enzyme)
VKAGIDLKQEACPYTWGMEIFMVGGAVRDALLGLPVQDHDWVVVGATPEELTAQGYLPVGKERKTARGYRGFEVHAAPDVTLEEDLARRDLTINSIAMPSHGEGANGQFSSDALIDPYGGRKDLADKVLRHVTDAFREDPVRILRVARFAARFVDFRVAPETMTLMREMVETGEADALVAERVWQELARGLMEVLRECGALKKLLPEVDKLWGVPQRADYHPEIDTGIHLMMVLDMSARLQAGLAVRFACLCHDLGKGTTPADILPRHIGHEERSARLLLKVCERLRVPVECRELAEVVAREHGNIHRSAEFGAAALVRLFERCDAFRKPQRFGEALLACECDARGRLGLDDKASRQRTRLGQALVAAQSVATEPVAQAAQAAGLAGAKIGEMIHTARVQAVQEWLGSSAAGQG